MSRMQRLVLLGSTGSIGQATLQVAARHPGRFRVAGLAAWKNSALLLRQAREFSPKAVALHDPEAAEHVRDRVRNWKHKPQVWAGPEGVLRLAGETPAEMAVSAIVGTAGLLPTLAAIEAGKDIALANKETLVMAGELVMRAVRRKRVRLLPVDSEHAALAQCLHGHHGVPVRRLLLTASGGPFLRTPDWRLSKVRVEDALRHPTWSMGRKITVDSATLMNKGLEIIEAHHLFRIPYARIEVVIHPQSLVHSLVEFTDGSVLAQLSNPDMRLPIQTALTDPERLPDAVSPLDFQAGLNLTFEAPDTRRFPALELAYWAGKLGGTAPAVLNAANEVAVQGFLEERLAFPEIASVVKRVLNRHSRQSAGTLRAILQADAWARQAAQKEISCKRCK